jgi:RNA polymerase sigma-70 factor (ECF subfamily)
MQPGPQRVSLAEIDDLTLARARRGEGPAFTALVQQYQGAVWAYLWRMLGPAATTAVVEDLFQETFLGVHRGLPRFDPAGVARLSTWILAIATWVALHRRRAMRRDAVAASGPELDDGGAQAHGIERRTMVAALVAALEALSPDHRAVLILREFHDLEYDEIARALHLEVGTVRSRLHRARESLRRAFEEKP